MYCTNVNTEKLVVWLMASQFDIFQVNVFFPYLLKTVNPWLTIVFRRYKEGILT